jgi:hypothetical protein
VAWLRGKLAAVVLGMKCCLENIRNIMKLITTFKKAERN